MPTLRVSQTASPAARMPARGNGSRCMLLSTTQSVAPDVATGQQEPPWRSKSIPVICGVSGSGKSAVGKALSVTLGCAFHDGDDYHPASNIAKMKAGVPLTDEDRWPWLDTLASVIQQHASRGEHAVVACSALKARYRARLRAGVPGGPPSPAILVLLDPPLQQLQSRLTVRAQEGSHFMPLSLLDSQLLALERPSAGSCCFTSALEPGSGAWVLLPHVSRPDGSRSSCAAREASTQGITPHHGCDATKQAQLGTSEVRLDGGVPGGCDVEGAEQLSMRHASMEHVEQASEEDGPAQSRRGPNRVTDVEGVEQLALRYASMEQSAEQDGSGQAGRGSNMVNEEWLGQGGPARADAGVSIVWKGEEGSLEDSVPLHIVADPVGGAFPDVMQCVGLIVAALSRTA